MAETKVTGVIIKIDYYREHDLIIKLLTSQAISAIIALGTRKITSKNKYALRLGNLVELEIFQARLNSSLSKLKRATLLRQPALEKNSSKAVLVELLKAVNQITVSNATIFQLLNSASAILGAANERQIATIIYNYCLVMLGYQQIATQCVDCGTTNEIADYSFYRGGLLCKRHKKRSLTKKLLVAFINLNTDHNLYLKTDALTNQIVFKELKVFWNEVIY